MLPFLVIIAVIGLMSVGLTAVQFRRETPLSLECRKCGAEFRQMPHLDYPKKCPRCRALDWAV